MDFVNGQKCYRANVSTDLILIVIAAAYYYAKGLSYLNYIPCSLFLRPVSDVFLHCLPTVDSWRIGVTLFVQMKGADGNKSRTNGLGHYIVR